jgi:L-rhamnonate dehydratase
MKLVETALAAEPFAPHDAGATQIVRVTYDKVFVPFHRENVWSAGVRPGTTRLLVRVETADGTVGYGETICLLEFVEPVLERTIIPLSLGEDAFNIERLVRKVEGAGYYHHKRAMVAALAGLEMALWDVVGKQAGLPLYKLWGGAFRRDVPMIAYLMASSLDRLVSDAAQYVERGFGTIKLKIGIDERSDIEIVRAVREAVGPDVRIRADVNGAWTIGTAKRQLRKLEQYDLEYVEQPLPLEDLAGHAVLRRMTSIPIALDESAYTLQDVMAIIRADAADVILLDAHEAGGLNQARKAAAVCEAAGLPVTLHCGGELGVSTAANLHLASTLPNLLLAIDSQYHNQNGEVVTEPFRYERGAMRAPEAPGLGVELDAEQVARFRTEEIHSPYLDPNSPGWFPTKPQY